MAVSKIKLYRVVKPGREDLNRAFDSKKKALAHARNYGRLGFSPRAGRYIGKNVGGPAYVERVREDGTVERIND